MLNLKSGKGSLITISIGFSLVIVSLFSSCYRDIIDMDLDDYSPGIVIEGAVTDQPGPYQVRVSKTGSFQQVTGFPPVSDAEVVISSDQNPEERLQEISPGLYQTQTLQGRAGRDYLLKVVSEGQEYIAESTMPEALLLDYLRLEFIGWGYLLVCAFTDRQGVEDFCRLEVYKNGELADRWLYQGRYSDGEQIIIENFDVYFEHGDQLRVRFLTINRATYEYLSLLNPDEGGGGFDPESPDFMPITLANPKTNINNNALGYFSAHAVRTYTRTVP
jgi:hypothetical protein